MYISIEQHKSISRHNENKSSLTSMHYRLQFKVHFRVCNGQNTGVQSSFQSM